MNKRVKITLLLAPFLLTNIGASFLGYIYWESALAKKVVEAPEAPPPLVMSDAIRINYREYESLDALKEWLKKDDLNTALRLTYPFGGEVTLKLSGMCGYYARELQYRALTQGYLMSIQYEATLNDDGTVKYYHGVNTVSIKNTVYIIEPQTDEVRAFARNW